MILLMLILALISLINGLPTGAPSTACRSLTPFHEGGIPAQQGIPPYTVGVRSFLGGVEVSIASLLGVTFQGFMLQGRTPNGEVLGSFQLDNQQNNATLMSCSGSGIYDTLTHNNPNEKTFLVAVWVPPPTFEGPVMFNSTVAESYSKFWVGIRSPTIEITKRSVQDPEYPITRPNKQQTSTPPYYNENVEKPRQSSTEFDNFYTNCGNTKLCFGSSPNCINNKNCKAAVAVTVNGQWFDFEMKVHGNNAKWVGVGLSDDNKMGDDSVIECVKTPNGVKAYMSWTTARPYSSQRLSNPQLGINLLNSSVVDDAIYCKVARSPTTVINGKTFDLLKDKYYFLLAAGTSIQSSAVSFHDLLQLPSADAQYLSDIGVVGAASKILVRLHGCFMLAAWIGTASLGILLARYYRHTWVGTTMMGKDLWFAWHRIFMILTWLLTIVGFVLIFTELKAWSNEKNPHAILGTIVTILCFIQPIGAYFRPHPGTSRRPIFNWLHWLIGNTAHIVAIVTIFFAVKLTKAELPLFMDYILAFYVVFHCVIHIFLSIMNCISEKRSDGRVSAFPMKDLGSHTNASSAYDHNMDSAFSTCRKFILGVYVVLIFALVITLIVITSMAPVEGT